MRIIESKGWWVVIHWDKYPVTETLSCNRGTTLRMWEELFKDIFPYPWKRRNRSKLGGLVSAKVVRATISWDNKENGSDE